LGFCASTPSDAQLTTIIFYEALCVASAITWASELPKRPYRLLIFTDSLNTIEMFNSLHASEGYDELLLFMMQILISTKVSLHVFHIPGADNLVADTLSCHLLTTTASLLPGPKTHLFQPPRSMLGLLM